MKVNYKIPIMLGVTVVMFILLKIWLPAPAKNTELVNNFWLTKTHGNAQFNFVVGGDSRVYRGVSVDAIEKAVGADLHGHNLGYSSAGFSTEYMNFLTSRLSPKGQRFMVLGITPHSFTMDAAANSHYHQFYDIPKLEIYKGLYLSGVLKHFAPYRMSEIRDYVKNKPKTDYYFEDFTNQGWVRSDKRPEDMLVALQIYRDIFTKYQIKDSLVTNFFKVLEGLKKESIQVIAYRPPTFDAMVELEDSLSGFNEDYVRAEMERRGCIWIDFQNKDFKTYDGSHLHYDSAEKLGRLIGEEMKRGLW
jgi:hypothetical protein